MLDTENISEQIRTMFDEAIARGASDIHFTVGIPPIIRIDGKLSPFPGATTLTEQDAEKFILSLLTQDQLEKFKQQKEIDFSFGYKEIRLRSNIYYQKGCVAASLRLIPNKIRTIEELGLPPILQKYASPSQGLVIFTGPTGSGKSTSLAAMIDFINNNYSKHIITIEDPIEYVFEHKKSILSQREVGSDTNSFARALRSSLREDPDVVLVGEMRDLETIDAALTIAETGHLVLTTLHTNSASQTADRIIDIFPPHQQQQVRSQFASVILAVVSQRLIPRVSGGRIAACEIMLANSAVRTTIREGKTHQLQNIIQTSASEGMIGLDKVLAELVTKGEISIDDALTWALDPKGFKMMIY